MTEFNYGHRHSQQHPTLTDFPHILLDGELQLGRGWTIEAEAEYERFRTDGQWQNNFRDNYTTNKLYLNKSWSDALNVKAGIIDVPVGTTNSFGPALTIYDPLDESTLMPMTWHEGGVALWGSYRRWHYQVGGYCYVDAPLKRSRLLGTAFRVGYQPVQGLDVSVSYFYGSSKEGMDQRWNPNLAQYDHMYHAALDFSYLTDRWTVDGQLVASGDHSNKALGLEAGYDVAPSLGLTKCSIIPFTRYDAYFHVNGTSCNKTSLGLNTQWPFGITVKAEAAYQNPTGPEHLWMTDISLGWQCSF